MGKEQKMPKPTDEQIVDKLDQILRVLSIQVAEDKSLTERARLLKLAGMENQAIADVLNIPVESVRTLTSNLRRPGGKGRGGRRPESMKGASQKEKIKRLNMAGFSNIEIAEFLQIKPTAVAVFLYESKKPKSSRKR